MSRSRLLILESDQQDVQEYQRILGSRYALKFVASLAAYDEIESAERSSYDLVISDMQFEDGELTKHLARRPSAIPLLVVSRSTDLARMREIRKLGAKSYLVKPFHENALLFAVESGLEREGVARIGVTSDTFQVVTDDNLRSAQLTAKEMQIFSSLRASWGEPVERERLVNQVWGRVRVGGKSLDVHVFHLRRKIAPLGLKIEYVPDRGFRLCDSHEKL